MDINNRADWLQPVSNEKRVSRLVVDKITEAIATGKLKPGDMLPSESQLVESMGVGKSSIREAIKMLEAIGVVEVIRGNCSRIRTSIDQNALSPLTYQLLFQSQASRESLVQFRRAIEVPVACIAAETITDGELANLWSIQWQLEQCVSEHVNAVNLDIAFHMAIYQATHNPFFSTIGATIMQLFKPSMEISNRNHTDIVIRNHRGIIAAAESHSPQEMRLAIEDSIQHWSDLSV